MRIEKLSLVDGLGGLNDNVLGAGLKKNEFSRLENYYSDEPGVYLKKRRGKELVQYAPIKPTVFTSDAATLALWHLDDFGSYPDSGPNGYALSARGINQIFPELGIFADGQRLAVQQPVAGLWDSNPGSLLANNTVNVIHGLGQVTLEAWCKIDPSFSGQPLTATLNGVSRTLSDSGCLLVGTLASGGAGGPGEIVQGISVHRDWDEANSQNASDPYFKFTLNTAGVAGTQTVIQSLAVPMSRWLHVRAEYDAVTGLMDLYVNGDLHASGSPVGAGTVEDSSAYVGVGGAMAFTGNPSFNLCRTFRGVIDEVRISTSTRTASEGFPFKEPRGMGFEFSKSDGVRQAVVAADDGLFYTLGDTGWTEIQSGFSPTAFWDAFFRKDVLYLSNGTNTPKAWDGLSLVDWGVPTAAPQLDLGAVGSVTAGTHLVCYTYVYGDYETGMSPAEKITSAGEEINVSAIPPRHSNCSAVRVYMTKAGETDAWYLQRQITHTPDADMAATGAYVAGSPAGYGTDSGALGVADGSFGTASYPTMASEVQTALMPNGKYLLGEHDRAFACGMEDEPYALRWSELGAPDVFKVLSFVPAASNKGGLTALASFYGEIHASKSGEATLVLRGEGPSNWSVFETMHPNVGCIDHWGYVHRYLVDSDRYVLCFPGRDGFYEYAGQQIKKISEVIQGTVDRLVQNNATKNEWISTTQAQFRSQLQAGQGGSATINVVAPTYEQDGLRDVPGRVAMLDQMDYLGLWNRDAQLIAGNLISIVKADGEGCFYFATDDSSELRYTPDNFVSYQTVGGSPIVAAALDERIIQIVRRGTDNFWFLITDSANADGLSSGGGHIYSVEDPMGTDGYGPVWQSGADMLYYDLDVPIRMRSSDQSGTARNVTGIGYGNAPYSLFLNHPQSVRMLAGGIGAGSSPGVVKAVSDINGAGVFSIADVNSSFPIGSTFYIPSLAAGFWAVQAEINGPKFGWPDIEPSNTTFTNFQFFLFHTRREFPRWRGGTFSPQAVWDATNSRLLFLAARVSAANGEDAYGNRLTEFQSVTDALVLTNWTYGGRNVSAFTQSGTALLFWTVEAGAVTGFTGRINQSTMASPNTGVANAAVQTNLVAARLSLNAATTTARYLGLFKYLGVRGQDFWTYQGSIKSIPTATSVPETLLDLDANGDSGPMPLEVAVQTTSPYKTYVSVSRLTTVAIYTVSHEVDSSDDVAVFKTEAYEGEGANAPLTGILSNLLFVPFSDSTGDYKWADRLYFYGSAADADDSRMVQIGIPGEWTVQGQFVSEEHNFGTFAAFDSLASSFAGGGTPNALTYAFRNAVDVATLQAATYIQQQPNTKIAGFVPVQPYGQWKVDLTWTYSVATPTTAPYFNFVTIGYFLGNAVIPRIVGIHFEGRTYWTVAEDGATYNNVVLVYQKNNTWTKLYAWELKCMFMFRNQLHALEAYQLVKIESGVDDMGSLIVGKARTGYMMGFVDKLVTGIQANVAAFANNLFSNKPGYIKITPYQADTELPDSAWAIQLPDSTSAESRRVQGVPWNGFRYDWVRALALEIGTSEDVTGDYVPYVGQPEQIQQVDVTLELTAEAYDLTVT